MIRLFKFSVLSLKDITVLLKEIFTQKQKQSVRLLYHNALL